MPELQRPSNDGPENMPLREVITTFPMVVSVYKINDDTPQSETLIDYRNKENRLWIGRITVWACRNGMTVETMAKKDWDKLK